MNVKDKRDFTELEMVLKRLKEYCEENGHPLFAATWQTPTLKKDDGYVYEFVSPLSIGLDIKAEYGEKDRFPEFLGAIMGFDRDNYNF